MEFTAPIKLTSSRAWRTYTGGSQIDKIHGIPDSVDTQFPEEWIMSTVIARNAGREDIEEGMCYLQSEQDVSLKDFIQSDPEKALGAEHLGQVGSTTGVLVKVIDAAERLTVQVHPDKQKALELFNSRFGKTECWHILGGRTIDGEEPSIYMGFKEGITREEWKRCFDEQDIPALLSHMHHFYVKPGETYLIKGGVPHAIGQGCLLVEIQEPTDYTIRVERVTPKGLKVADMGCHQGLGFVKMFDCFHYDGITEDEVFRRWRIAPRTIEENADFKHSQIIGYESTSCFKLERFDVQKSCRIGQEGKFCGLYILSGSGKLICNGREETVNAGDQFFVPAASDSYTIENNSQKNDQNKNKKEQENHNLQNDPLTLLRFFGPEINGSDKA